MPVDLTFEQLNTIAGVPLCTHNGTDDISISVKALLQKDLIDLNAEDVLYFLKRLYEVIYFTQEDYNANLTDPQPGETLNALTALFQTTPTGTIVNYTGTVNFAADFSNVEVTGATV